MGAAEWATAAVTLVLGVAGFILARNIGRDLKLRLAERRLAAYERLWALMRPASPYSEGYSGGRVLWEVYFFPRHVAIMRMACS